MNHGTMLAWAVAVVSASWSLVVVLGTMLLLIASAPNSTGRQQRVLKACTACVAAACVMGLASGVWLAMESKPWISAACLAVPGLTSLVALTLLRIGKT